MIIPELFSPGKLLKWGTGNGKMKNWNKTQLEPLPFQQLHFQFSALFPFSKFPVPRSQRSLNIPFSWRAIISVQGPSGRLLALLDSPMRASAVHREREYLSHKWRNRKSSNTVEPCVKQTPFVKRTDGLVCFKRFFLHFLLNEPLCSEHQWLPQASLRSKCRNGRKGKREGGLGRERVRDPA